MNRSSHHFHRESVSALCGFVTAVLATVVLVPGCESDDSPSGPGLTAPFGMVVGRTDCKLNAAVAAVDAPPNQDCVEWSYSGQGTLTLKHVNAGFNCCPIAITADFTITEDEITIVEHEQSGGCRCLCLFDIDYRIVNLPVGIYTIRFVEPYLLGDPPLAVRVGLASNPAGSFCVDRTHYPWHEPSGAAAR